MRPGQLSRCSTTPGLPPLLAAALLVAALGCTRGAESSRQPIHPNPNMDRQAKLLPQAESDFFYDGAAMQEPVPGTIARGDLPNPTLTEGQDRSGAWVEQSPLAADEAILARGQERYGIFCSPCHGESGNGRGVLYTRANVECADLRQDRLVQMPDGELFATVANGVGLMPSMRSRISAEDRWAILHYVRTLQEEQP